MVCHAGAGPAPERRHAAFSSVGSDLGLKIHDPSIIGGMTSFL